jgi:metal-responsive CopG/Arc/MetJ family transcriptional regulator
MGSVSEQDFRATEGSMIGRMIGMAKEKISVTVDAAVLAVADTDAAAAGLNRSELIEQALRNEHLRIALHNYTTRTVPGLDIDAYADKVYQANRAAGL